MRGRLSVPAWLISTVLHVLGLFLAAALTATAPRGVADEPVREIGIVLAQDTGEKREYFEAETPQDNADADDPAAAGSNNSGSSLSATRGTWATSPSAGCTRSSAGPARWRRTSPRSSRTSRG